MFVLCPREQIVLERVIEYSKNLGYPSGLTKATISSLEYKQLIEKRRIKNMRRYFVTDQGIANHKFMQEQLYPGSSK